MAPEIAHDVLKRQRGLSVLDPMAGSGTTLAAARKYGHQAYGVDSDPLAVLISRCAVADLEVKTFLADSSRLLAKAREKAGYVTQSEAYPVGADDETKAFVRYWFDLRSRKQLYALTRVLEESRLRQKNFMRLAISRLIITKSLGVSLASDVSHSRPHRTFIRAPISPFDGFLKSARDVTRYSTFCDGQTRPTARVYRADARRLPFDDEMFDVVITSPPYLNAIDYMRGHRMSLVWFGYPLSKLRSIRSSNVGAERGSATTHYDWALRRMLPDMSVPARTLGFARRYLSDAYGLLSEIARVSRPNATAVFVIGDCTTRGIDVFNSEGIDALARKLGFRPVSRRTREIPQDRRYMPPPTHGDAGSMRSRMWNEVILRYAIEK